MITDSPGSPTLINAPSLLTCDPVNGNQVTLNWTNTGGLYYLLNVTGPAGYTCPADQCNVTTINTTITGLLCSSNYTVTVRAVNCAGASGPSQPVVIRITGQLSKFKHYTVHCLMLQCEY